MIDTRPGGESRARRIVLEMTPAEAKLLWLVIGNGAGDDALSNLGIAPAGMAKFGRLANRIADAAGIGGPRFHEHASDYRRPGAGLS